MLQFRSQSWKLEFSFIFDQIWVAFVICLNTPSDPLLLRLSLAHESRRVCAQVTCKVVTLRSGTLVNFGNANELKLSGIIRINVFLDVFLCLSCNLLCLPFRFGCSTCPMLYSLSSIPRQSSIYSKSFPAAVFTHYLFQPCHRLNIYECVCVCVCMNAANVCLLLLCVICSTNIFFICGILWSSRFITHKNIHNSQTLTLSTATEKESSE